MCFKTIYSHVLVCRKVDVAVYYVILLIVLLSSNTMLINTV